MPQELLTHRDRQDPRVRAFVEQTLKSHRFTRTAIEATTGGLTIDALNTTLRRTPPPPQSGPRPAAKHRRRITRHHHRR